MIHEPKLDFKDVLIMPQLTTLSSRQQVSLERKFEFPISQRTWRGVPVIAANMDTTGTFEVAEVFAQYKMLTAMHKHYTIEQFVAWGKKVGPDVLDYVAVTAGVSDHDYDKVKTIFAELPHIKFICLDVANGY